MGGRPCLERQYSRSLKLSCPLSIFRWKRFCIRKGEIHRLQTCCRGLHEKKKTPSALLIHYRQYQVAQPQLTISHYVLVLSRWEAISFMDPKLHSPRPFPDRLYLTLPVRTKTIWKLTVHAPTMTSSILNCFSVWLKMQGMLFQQFASATKPENKGQSTWTNFLRGPQLV